MPLHTAKRYDKCIVTNGAVTGEYQASAGDKVLEKEILAKISSKAEADRFAKNLLRFYNKQLTKGVCYSGQLLTGYAAGSLVDIESEGAPSWNGYVFVTHVRHDLINRKSKMWFRKPLEGY